MNILYQKIRCTKTIFFSSSIHFILKINYIYNTLHMIKIFGLQKKLCETHEYKTAGEIHLLTTQKN